VPSFELSSFRSLGRRLHSTMGLQCLRALLGFRFASVHALHPMTANSWMSILVPFPWRPTPQGRAGFKRSMSTRIWEDLRRLDISSDPTCTPRAHKASCQKKCVGSSFRFYWTLPDKWSATRWESSFRLSASIINRLGTLFPVLLHTTQVLN